MKRKLALISLNLLAFFILVLPFVARVSAAVLTNPLKSTTLAELIDTILSAVLQIGVVVITCSIIYAGFKYATSRGRPAQIAQGHKGMLWTIAGSAIVLGAYAVRAIVMETVKGVFGAN